MRKIIIKVLAKFIELRTKWRGNLHHFRRSVRKAEKYASGNGQLKGMRHYVYFLGGRYRVLNRKQIQQLRIKGIFKPNMNTHSLAKICLYDTMTKQNSHPQFRNAKL